MPGDDELITKKNCADRSGQILAAIKLLDDRLYHDNGHISIQTRLDRHERLLRAMCWALSIAGSALIVSLIGFLLRALSIPALACVILAALWLAVVRQGRRGNDKPKG